MDQSEDTLAETQRRLSLKSTDLQLAQDKNVRQCEKIGMPNVPLLVKQNTLTVEITPF